MWTSTWLGYFKQFYPQAEVNSIYRVQQDTNIHSLLQGDIMKRSKNFRWYIFPGIMIVFALAFTPRFTSKSFASPSAPIAVKSQPVTQAADGKLIEKVGFYVLGITDLNVATGSYTMDGYLNFECNLSCNEDPGNPAFDIMNATGEPEIEEQTSDTKGNTVHYYRIRVPLASNLILKDFPFDYHLLTMHIEDKILGDDELTFEFDPGKSGVDDFAIVSGWEVEREIKGEIIPHKYAIYTSPYSRLVFSVAIYHPWFSSFMKGLFAAVVIIMVGMLSFLMKYDEIGERLALTSSTLVGAILYHLTLTASIPPVGYMTFADKFMLANYVILFAALAVTVRLMLLVNAEEHDTAKKLHKYTQWLIPTLWLVMTVYLIVFGMSIPLWEYIQKFGF